MSIDTDKFLVSRSGTNYSIEQQNLMANLEDTDLMLVSRAGTNYKITGVELKDSLGPSEIAPVMDSVILAADAGNANRFTDATYNATLVMNPEGNPVPTKALKAEVRGQLSVLGESDEIVDITPESGWNQKQTWSNLPYSTQDDTYGYPAVNAFNGTLNDSYENNWYANSSLDGYTAKFDANGQLDNAKTVEIAYTIAASPLFKVNGVLINTTSDDPLGVPDGLGYRITIDVTGVGLQTIEFDNTGAYLGIGYIIVDGQQLINQGVPGAPPSYALLTLASDVNLETFKAGDAVKQDNSPITPVSSAITNVNGNVLTLTNSDGLDDFQVGDVVKQEPKSPLTELLYSVGIGSGGRAGVADRTTQWNSTYYSISLATGTFDTPSVNGSIMLDLGSDASTIDYTFTASSGSYAGTWFAGNDLINWVDSGITGDNGTLCELKGYRYWWYETNTNSTTNTFSGTLVSQSTGIVTSVGPGNLLTLTDTDGVWEAGPSNYVTGPSTDITATFVSADPSVPSMTLSDVVGPWTANTGRTVVNTVENPVLVKPESSAITNVDNGTTTTARLFASPNADVASNKQAILDNWTEIPFGTTVDFPTGNFLAVIPDLNATGPVFGLNGTTTFQYNSSVAASGGHFDADGNLLGGDGSYGKGEWVLQNYIDTNVTPIGTSYSVPSNTNGYTLFKIGGTGGTNGTVSGSETATLTLTDDTDLNQFATGDNVYVAGVAPQSFAPVIYTGNSGTQSIDVGFAPDLVWIKDRDDTRQHMLYDIIRGAGKHLISNLPDGQYDNAQGLTSFNADGFSLGTIAEVNQVAKDFVAWCWSAGDTTVTNNEGTIASQVRSNGTFSIATLNSPADGASNIWGHGLNTAPAFAITKSAGTSDNWHVYHKDLNGVLFLNNSDPTLLGDYWVISDTTIGTPALWDGVSGALRVSYQWAESPTQSFGEYTGNNATTTVSLGFEPALVMIKLTSSAGQGWYIFDTARGKGKLLVANNDNPEYDDSSAGVYGVELNSDGFTVTSSDTGANESGQTYIYAAFSSAGGPSGVVGDITGLDMTLSESTGTWEVGQKVTMDEKEAVISTLYCELDTIGNVTGLTSVDPGYIDQASNATSQQVKFPTQFPTGNTPDVDLPEGTSIHVSARATNELGTSTAESNTLFPS